MSKPAKEKIIEAAGERFMKNMKQAQIAKVAFGLNVAAIRPAYSVKKFHCIVCGAEMKAQRSSKKTCSDRCRTKLSRLYVSPSVKFSKAIRLFQTEHDERQARLKRGEVIELGPPASRGKMNR